MLSQLVLLLRLNQLRRWAQSVATKPGLYANIAAKKKRKSFCARMGGVAGPMKDEKGRPTRKALALKKWDC
jgi:hypothetical protein